MNSIIPIKKLKRELTNCKYYGTTDKELINFLIERGVNSPDKNSGRVTNELVKKLKRELSKKENLK